MNAAHIHLLVNHLPVFGVILGVAVLLAGRIRRSAELMRAGFALLVVAGIGAGAAYLSGERAEEIVEDLAGVSEAMIEEHEDSAWFALIGAAALGLAGLIGLARFRGDAVAPWLVNSSLLLGLLTAAAIARTAFLGGQIRHSEIRAGAIQADRGGDAAGRPGLPEPDDEER
jgi:uncharacterized membrane protein